MTRRRRTLWLALAVAGLLVVAFAGWWVYGLFTLTAEERNLVGYWRQASEGVPTHNLIVEFELRDDRTVLLVNRDGTTEAVTFTQDEYDDWRLREGVLTARVRQLRPAGPWYALRKYRPPPQYDVLRLQPEGPDCYRYTLLRSDRVGVGLVEPLPAGTWTRTDPKVTR